MSKKDDKFYLKDILDSINAIENFISNINYDEFNNSRKTSSATIRELEIIGEAVGKLSNKVKQDHPGVNWQDIKDMRNFLIHEYFGVDLEIVWKVVNEDLPNLKSTIKYILDS